MRGARQRLAASLALLGSVALLLGCVAPGAGRSAEGSRVPDRFEFGLIGDQQYTAADEARFERLLEALNAADLAFVIHVGDIKGAFTPCSDELFARRKDAFQASRHPLIYTPGDNEWTDCHDPRAGGHDPLERLARLRAVFFEGGRSLGRRAWPLTRQSDDPRYAAYRENVRWTHGGVLFATLHMVGSNDNLGRTPAMDAEHRERTAANLAWLRQAFEIAGREGYGGVVIATQANPGFENRWPPVRLAVPFGPLGPMGRPPVQLALTGFDDFLDALEAEVLAYRGAVVLVHGDSHLFRIDKPLVGSRSRRTIERFTRVETFGSPEAHWVRGIVDLRDPGVFTFRPEIVETNRVDHSAR